MALSNESITAQRLSRLATLYERGQASDLMDRTLGKLLAHEADSSRVQLDQLRSDLAEFEERYGMSSEVFYQRYQTGQTDDRMDFVEWAALVQMAARLEERIQLLMAEDRG